VPDAWRIQLQTTHEEEETAQEGRDSSYLIQDSEYKQLTEGNVAFHGCGIVQVQRPPVHT